MPGAHEEHVAGANPHALGALGGVEVCRLDGHARRNAVHAPQPRDVEQDPAGHDARAEPIDGVPRRAAGGDRRRGKAVVEAAVVVGVREAVPLRRALKRHDDDVVAVAELALPDTSIERAHQVDRVHAPVRAELRPVGAEREAEAEDLAAFHASCGAPHEVGRDEVDRAALVLRSPAPPVGDPGSQRPEEVHGQWVRVRVRWRGGGGGGGGGLGARLWK